MSSSSTSIVGPLTVFGALTPETEAHLKILYRDVIPHSKMSGKSQVNTAAAPVSKLSASAVPAKTRETTISSGPLGQEADLKTSAAVAVARSSSSSCISGEAIDASCALLKKIGAQFQLHTHPKSPTIEDWRPHCEALFPDAVICKNLFLKDKKKTKLILLVALAETTVDMKAVASLLRIKNPRLAADEVLMEVLGLERGAVTPLALVADKEHRVTLVLDKAMLDKGTAKRLLYHPLSGNDRTVNVTTAELDAYLAETGHTPIVIDFVEKELVAR